MTPGTGALLVAVSIVGLVVLLELLAIIWSKVARERRERIETIQREALLDDLIEVIERDDLDFSVTGTMVTIGDRSFTVPAPRGLRGRATRETIISLIGTISGTGRERLVTILENAEYVDRAIRSLVSTNPADRVRVCMVLGGMMSRQAIPWLSTRFLDDPNAAVRLAAAEALARIGDPPIVPVLLRAIHNRTRWQHLRIANVLAQMGSAAVPQLAQTLSSNEDSVVLLALDILSDIGVVDDVDAVEALLVHPNPEIRARAIELLGVIGNLEALTAIMDASRDSVAFVRVRVAKTLAMVGPQDDPGLAARYRETLEHLAADPEWWARQHAIRALAALENVSA